MGPVDAIALILGVFLLVLTLWDLFETIVVPRPTPGWFRIGRYLIRGIMAGAADPSRRAGRQVI